MWGLEAWSAAGFQEGQVRPAHLRRVLTQEPWAGRKQQEAQSLLPLLVKSRRHLFIHSASVP